MQDTDTDRFMDALADDDLTGALAALDSAAASSVGARLFTVMALDPDTGISERIWTNAPDVYPTGGRKPLPDNRWTDLVIRDRQPFIANTPDDIAAVLFDHATIAALGCGSCLNLPVVVAGQVLGTLNLLDAPGFFTADRLRASAALRLPAAAVLMRWHARPGAQ